jgi:hypothetical protein
MYSVTDRNSSLPIHSAMRIRNQIALSFEISGFSRSVVEPQDIPSSCAAYGPSRLYRVICSLENVPKIIYAPVTVPDIRVIIVCCSFINFLFLICPFPKCLPTSHVTLSALMWLFFL